MNRSGFARKAILTAVLVVATAVILNETVFRIRSVDVKGNRNIPSDDVVMIAGLDGGASYFFVNEERVSRAINSYRYLIYRGMEKTPPNRLTLFVEERTPRCVFKTNSGYYLVDEEGMVLEKVETDALQGLIRLSGISVRETRVGNMLSATNTEQLKAYREILGELIEEESLTVFSEMNCADPENLYLTAAAGYTVGLGNAKDIRAKILTVRGVLEYMDIYKLPAGSLDASVPGSVTYTPE